MNLFNMSWVQRLKHLGATAPDKTGPSKLPKRVCIINFTGERTNWGCRATSWELVRLLNRHWPGRETFLLDVIPLVPHHDLDRKIPAQYGSEIRAALTNAVPTDAQKALILRITQERYLHYVDVIKRADLVLFQAEGTMTGTDFLRAERLLLLPWLAKHVFAKPVISVNQTLFSADAEFSQIIFTVFGALDQIWVREPASQRWLQANGFQHARLVPDTTFLTDPLDHGDLWKTLEGKDYFCVTGSAALLENHIPNYLAAVRSIAEATDLFPVFLCSVDMGLPKYAMEHWPEGSFEQINPGLIYPAVAHALGRARFLVGGRYHLSILAAISGTPSVLIETNTYKLTGLVEMLEVDWPIRKIGCWEHLKSDVRIILNSLLSTRPRLKLRASALRAETSSAFQAWYSPTAKTPTNPRKKIPFAAPEDVEAFTITNQGIASRFRYPAEDTPEAKLGRPQPILPQLNALTVYLRRGIHTEPTFRCLRQLVEGNLDLVLTQLNSRWLISICDSYADFGDSVEARNALLISTFLNWERLAATYIHWSEPDRTTLSVNRPVALVNEPLWDGLLTINLRCGDTTNNMLIRYAKLLESTPYLLRIWRTLLQRIRNNDSVMEALNIPHGHLFDENIDWMADERFTDIVPSWRIAD